MKTRTIAGFFLFLSLPYLSNAQYAESFTKAKGNNHSGFIEKRDQKTVYKILLFFQVN